MANVLGRLRPGRTSRARARASARASCGSAAASVARVRMRGLAASRRPARVDEEDLVLAVGDRVVDERVERRAGGAVGDAEHAASLRRRVGHGDRHHRQRLDGRLHDVGDGDRARARPPRSGGSAWRTAARCSAGMRARRRAARPRASSRPAADAAERRDDEVEALGRDVRVRRGSAWRCAARARPARRGRWRRASPSWSRAARSSMRSCLRDCSCEETIAVARVAEQHAQRRRRRAAPSAACARDRARRRTSSLRPSLNRSLRSPSFTRRRVTSD